MPNQRVTINQVAKEAGVSKQTVSRVINNRDDVAPETRSRVLSVIERLDYRPSAVARSLSHQRSFALGVVIAGLKYSGPSRTLNGITLEAEKIGYSVILKELPDFYANDDVQPLLDGLLSRHVDGLIWAVPEVGDNRTWFDDRVADLPVPILFLTTQSRQGFRSMAFDNQLGGFLACEHLVAQGRRCIGHISGPLDWWEARQRKLGWETALQQAGLPASDQFFKEGNWSPQSGSEAFRSLYARYPEMDAVFVGNDQMALGVLRTALELGLCVPEDIAVVGYDGLPEAGYYTPPLSTLDQDHYQLGSLVVREMIKIIQEEPEHLFSEENSQSILIKPQLIVRESSQVLNPVKQ